MTQEELAIELGITQGMVSHMETSFWDVNEAAEEWIGEVEEPAAFEVAQVRRRRLGMDIKEVAEKVGIPSWVLGKFEEGVELPRRASELKAYCEWLKRQPV